MENKDDNRYHLSLWLKTNGYIKYLHLKYPSPNIGVWLIKGFYIVKPIWIFNNTKKKKKKKKKRKEIIKLI